MLIYSMSVSVDGFIADREDAFEWTAPDEELFPFHTAEEREIGGAGLTAQAIELGPRRRAAHVPQPVVVGGGTPFLPPVTADIALDLIETRTFGSHDLRALRARP